MNVNPLDGTNAPEQQTSVLEIASIPMRRWRVVCGVPLGAGLLAGAISLVLPQRFTATLTFVPQASTQARVPSSLSGLAALAGQVGISLGGDPSQSPRFYADIVKSRELLERILLTRYQDPRAGTRDTADSTTLLRILGVRGRDLADSLERGVKKAGKLISTRVDVQTSMVHVTVVSRDANLSAAIASHIVEFLNDFNTKKRQSRARELRRFIEMRIADADKQLQDAEDRLKQFYQRNRSWQQSPELVFEEGRLRRRVDIRQEVSLTLQREYETARIEEVNDTPVITVIDPPVAPSRKSSPKRVLLVILSVFLGGLIGMLWAFGAEHLEEMNRANAPEYERFRSAATHMRVDLARLLPLRARKAARDDPPGGNR